MKKCFKCNAIRPLSEFYKHSQMADGHINKCKDCSKKAAQNNYQAKREYYREYEKSRLRAPHRLEARREYGRLQWKTNREGVLEYKRKWASANPERRRITLQKQREKFPKKYKARMLFNNAVRDGRITRQACERCGNLRAHGHHEDYSQPLEVVWLCSAHHAERHKELQAIGSTEPTSTDTGGQ